MGISQAFSDAFSAFKRSTPLVARAYLFQSIELVAISRELVAARAQGFNESDEFKDASLRSLLNTIEQLLESATHVKPGVDEAFTRAAELLWDYKMQHFPTSKIDAKNRMEEALSKDASVIKRTGAILQSHKQRKIEGRGPEMKVEIMVGKGGLTNEALGVHKDFGRRLSLSYVLWEMLREGKVTLSQNPHFYINILEFERDHFTQPALPLEQKLEEIAHSPHLHVLVDREHYIRVKLSGARKMFGNIWESKQAKNLVLKEITGELTSASNIQRELKLQPTSPICLRSADSVEQVFWTKQLTEIARNEGSWKDVTIEDISTSESTRPYKNSQITLVNHLPTNVVSEPGVVENTPVKHVSRAPYLKSASDSCDSAIGLSSPYPREGTRGISSLASTNTSSGNLSIGPSRPPNNSSRGSSRLSIPTSHTTTGTIQKTQGVALRPEGLAGGGPVLPKPPALADSGAVGRSKISSASAPSSSPPSRNGPPAGQKTSQGSMPGAWNAANVQYHASSPAVSRLAQRGTGATSTFLSTGTLNTIGTGVPQQSAALKSVQQNLPVESRSASPHPLSSNINSAAPVENDSDDDPDTDTASGAQKKKKKKSWFKRVGEKVGLLKKTVDE